MILALIVFAFAVVGLVYMDAAGRDHKLDDFTDEAWEQGEEMLRRANQPERRSGHPS